MLNRVCSFLGEIMGFVVREGATGVIYLDFSKYFDTAWHSYKQTMKILLRPKYCYIDWTTGLQIALRNSYSLFSIKLRDSSWLGSIELHLGPLLSSSFISHLVIWRDIMPLTLPDGSKLAAVASPMEDKIRIKIISTNWQRVWKKIGCDSVRPSANYCT